MSFLRLVTLPLRLLNPPLCDGLDNVPVDEPVLFVGNHNVYGLDMLVLQFVLYARTGVYFRPLYDTALSHVPVYKQILEKLGCVVGTRRNCETLMRANTTVLVYPGGGREMMKSKDDAKYELMWSKQLGFARLAIKHGYTVVPFASVGFEDAVRIIGDVPVGWLLKLIGDKRTNMRVPVLAPYNTLERHYFTIGQPISTKHYGNDWEDDAKCRELCTTARDAVVAGIAELQVRREGDPGRHFSARIKSVLSRQRTKRN